MNKLLRVVCMFCREMKMTLATSKTYIISNAMYDVNWSVNSETVKEIFVAKYLGVKIQLRGRNIIGQYEEIMIKRAMS